jgi:hypothetical protein
MYDRPTRRALGTALAGAFLAGAWTEPALVRRGTAVLAPRPRWLRRVVREVLAAYHRPPADRHRELAAYVELALEAGGTRLPAPRVRQVPTFAPDMGRTRWPVPALASPSDLAARLGLPLGELAWLADARGWERTAAEPRLRHYTYGWLARPGAPPRVLERPKARLKAVQRWILREILDAIPAHDAAHGFVRGRSARTHAERHAGRAVVVRFDLEDFFAGVAAARVFGVFRAAGYPEATAHVLTALCTNVVPQPEWDALPRPAAPSRIPRHHRLGRRLAAPHLPQGAPTSPALASLAAFGLDVRLTALAARLRARYSRYADDLAFSGDARLPVATLRRAVEEIVREEGFRTGPAKTRVLTRAARQTVCGIVVNERPNVSRRDYDRLKSVLHDAARHGPEAANRAGHPDFRAHLLGRIAWVGALHPERGARLRARFDAIRWLA